MSAYILGGFAKLLDFAGAVAEQEHFGLYPGWLWAAAAIVVELGGSLLVVLNRLVWLGAGGLGVLTFVAMLTANAFWTMEGHDRFMAMNAFFEHLGLIAGLVVVSILSEASAFASNRRCAGPNPPGSFPMKSTSAFVFLAFAAAVAASGQVAAKDTTKSKESVVAVAPQYDTTHVYVAPDDVDKFVTSFLATFGGKSTKQVVATVTPTPKAAPRLNSCRRRLAPSPCSASRPRSRIHSVPSATAIWSAISTRRSRARVLPART